MKVKNQSLLDLEVVVLDCQATHSDPTKGVVFEIGWAKTKASEASAPNLLKDRTESFLVKLPENIKISSSIKKITGIQDEDFVSSLPLKEIWPKLLADIQFTASGINKSVCPTIIHYARYETPFLKYFHKIFNPHLMFPFHIICTHQIIKRLFPGLPRKGLRAAAGYFGATLPETRRSLHHVLGTACIWSHVVRLFKEQEGPASFDGLLKWLDFSSSPVVQSRPKREYPMPKSYLKNLPALPGIYKMFRSNGDLLYIGKAKSLKHRVNSYFRLQENHSEHILEMLSQAKSLTYAVTKTALEAAIKESDEIKVFAPAYNSALRLSKEGPIFSTRDLRRFHQKPDQQYSIGPLPTKKYIEPLPVIMDFLNGKISGITPQVIQKTLGTPEEYSPEPAIFLQGLNEFKKQNAQVLKGPVNFQTLAKIGSHLWKKKLLMDAERRLQSEAEKDSLVLKSDPPKKKKTKASVHWTPESLAKVLSHIIRIGTFQIRRSRWFYLLTESALIWEAGKRGTDTKNFVVFKCGLPNFKDPLPAAQVTPFSAGYNKAFLSKQKNFDVFTYDRMRILTTEIRRILEEERTVILHLGPTRSLKSDQLREALKWV